MNLMKLVNMIVGGKSVDFRVENTKDRKSMRANGVWDS